jgi:RHS repeat-associated protein
MRISRSLIALIGFLFISALIALPAHTRREFRASASITNSPPVAVDDGPYTVHGSALLSPNVLANDSDPDGDPIFFDVIGQSPAHGFLSFGTGGAITYTVASNYVGPDSFTYRIGDNLGNESTFATVSINVVNDPPVAANDSYTIHGSKQLVPNVMANDSDPNGDTIFFDVIVQSPSHGTLSFGQGDLIIYNAHSVYVGPDSFTYRIKDSLGFSAIGTVNIDVVNQAPVAVNDLYVIRGAQSQQLFPSVLANDFDPDSEDYILFDIVVQFPTHGSLSLGGNGTDIIHYMPQPGYAGSDTFTYKMTDNLAVRSNVATVTLLVLGDGENDGHSGCNGEVGEPINVTNGNMYLQQGDHLLPSTGPAISIARSYNSNSSRMGLFGRGWSSAYDASITSYDSNLARLNQPDGRAIYFGQQVGSSGAFAPLEGDFHGSVVQNGVNGFTLTMKDGSVHQFDSTGKLISLADRNNNQTTLAYNGSGKLVSVTDPFARVLSFTTNLNGQVVSISDTIGTIASYTYGANNTLVSVTYADNSGFQFSYDGSSRLTAVTDALGNVVESHAYDGQGRAITSEKQGGVEHYSLNYVGNNETDATDALSHVTKYFFDTSKGRNVVTQVQGLCNCGSGSQTQTWIYDNQLNVISHTNALGQTATYTYDINGNNLSATGVLGSSSFTYNQFGEVLTATDAMGAVTTNIFDAVGNLLSVTDALNNTTTFTYDTRGQLATLTNALGKVTTLTYDNNGNITQATDAAGGVTTFAYDARGRVTSSTDALNFVTSYAYDAAGRLNKITRPDNAFITFTYDLAGRRTKVTDPLNNSNTYAYDSAYRLTGETDATGKSVGYSYDLMSNLVAATDQLGRVTNVDYDEFNRPTTITYPPAIAGATRLQQTIAYDTVGNITKRTDTAGRITALEYDNANRLVKVTDPALQITQYEYNVRSNMTAVVDALNQRYTFDYDALGRVTAATRVGLPMTYAYDAEGNRVQRTDFNNLTTNYTYDALNRLTKIAYPDATTASYAYDKLSQLTSATNVNGTVSYAYDNLRRVTSTTDVWGQVINYSYDANNRRTNMSFGTTTFATYTYDTLNRLIKITDNARQSVTYAYDAAGRLTSRALPNGITTNYSYDDLDRLTRLVNLKGKKVSADNNYQYNNAGDIIQNIDQSGTHAYGYDAVSHLTAASFTGAPNESYAYDAVGNRTSSQRSSTYSYQPFNRLVGTTSAGYVYDNNGNLTTKTEGAGTTQFQWDFENRLVQVVTPASGSVTYKYDALGRRVQSAPSSGASTNFSYDGQEVVLDKNSDGTALEYLNGPGIDNKIRQKGASSKSTYYFTQDHLGSTTTLTNTNGALVERETYDAYGNSAGSANTRYGYTGRERDPLTGLLYYRARWYDPQVGRFVSEDPIGLAGGINTFAYVSNNPQNATDPSGLHEIDVHYYLTYFLALKTRCFTDAEANLIATADLYADENPKTAPALGVSNFPGSAPDYAQQQRNMDDHALHPGSHQPYLDRLWRSSTSGEMRTLRGEIDNLMGLGAYLHYLQDMFSHEGYTNPSWGHWYSHGPDKTNADVPKAMRMAGATWKALNDFAAKYKCGCRGKFDESWWRQVKQFAEASGGPFYREISLDEIDNKVRILQLSRRSSLD